MSIFIQPHMSVEKNQLNRHVITLVSCQLVRNQIYCMKHFLENDSTQSTHTAAQQNYKNTQQTQIFFSSYCKATFLIGEQQVCLTE